MKKILIIEDEPQMRRNIVTILRLEQFEPIAAANGQEGVEIARRLKPDLILCDVMMPGVDGYGVLRELHDDPQTMNIPFIFLTAVDDYYAQKFGKQMGSAAYITKPVDFNELERVLLEKLGE